MLSGVPEKLNIYSKSLNVVFQVLEFRTHNNRVRFYKLRQTVKECLKLDLP